MTFRPEGLRFFEELAENNTKDWFRDNKDRFDRDVQTPFANLIDSLSNRLSDAPVPLLGSPRTMFRMHRDVRFSKDKSPYKTSTSAVLTPSGSKQEEGGLLFLQMDATGGFAAVGWHQLSPKALIPFRDAILAAPDQADQMRDALSKAGRQLFDGHSLKTMPRGYTDHRDHRHADMIAMRSLMVTENLPKAAFISGDVVDRVEGLARDVMPLLQWGRGVLP